VSGYHIAACPLCAAIDHGQGQVTYATTTINAQPVRCPLCGGIGVVRVRIKDIPIVRPNADGEWELVDDAVTQLGDVATG
jgi:hypothetical protein